VLRGYAVLTQATMPVIGDPETMNDTFIEQVTAAAHISALDAAGIADPGRVAVGGHSYGAFMTANLLAHTGLFAAGIARSGAYNRTLTPFGFQAERRSFWEAPQIYIRFRRAATRTRSRRRSCWSMASKTVTPGHSRSSRSACSRLSRPTAALPGSSCCRTRATGTWPASRSCTGVFPLFWTPD